MKKIRQFLVRNFVLDYTFKLFGVQRNAPRASRIIYPLVVLSGWISVTNPDWPTPTPLIWALYSLLSISLYFGFVHFRYFPPQWEELDNFQKFQYGVFKSTDLTKEQLEEWMEISEELSETL